MCNILKYNICSAVHVHVQCITNLYVLEASLHKCLSLDFQVGCYNYGELLKELHIVVLRALQC